MRSQGYSACGPTRGATQGDANRRSAVKSRPPTHRPIAARGAKIIFLVYGGMYYASVYYSRLQRGGVRLDV